MNVLTKNQDNPKPGADQKRAAKKSNKPTPTAGRAKSKVTCIIGMHRSGTSMVARILNLCGLDLGSPDQFMPPNTSNPLGYFEDQIISYKINDALLSHLGGSWNDPPDLEPGWEHDPSLSEFARKARSYIYTLSESTHWGWKDPRTTILLPFWKSLITDLRFVICIRRPLHVAESLNKRDEVSVSKGFSLWHQYVKAAILDTEGCPRIFTFYEDYFRDTRREIERLIDFCDLPAPNVAVISANAIFHKLTHTSEIHEVSNGQEVLAESNRLYERLRARKVTQIAEPTADSKEKIEEGETQPTRIANPRSAIPRYSLVFPRFRKPLVSIVVPTFNGVEYLSACLRTVFHYTKLSFELIIVDDGSHDTTGQLLDKIDNVRVVRNEKTLDFLKSSNSGARLAKGQYIMFLNNDVMVREHWLSKLVHTMERHPRCGAVGAKLIDMDGKLQEAGAIIWHDGTAVPYGGGDDPFKPEYCYLREVDYCSAACLLVRTDLFQELGGFDGRYAPAYYEDPDLCFGIRQLGYKVVVQPDVTIFHRVAGSRPIAEAEALYQANRPKFVQKWSTTLVRQESHNSALQARDRRRGKRVLVLYERIPDVDEDSSSAWLHELLNTLVELEFVVTFVPICERYQYQPATFTLQQAGVEVFYGDSFEPQQLLQSRAGYYQFVVVSESCKSADYIDLIRRCFPDAPVLAIDDLANRSIDGLKESMSQT